MQNTTNVEKTGVTVLTAINTAKVLSIGCLIAFTVIYGIQDFRQVIYLCLHISYLLWWLLEQWVFPQRRQIIFNEPIGVVGFILALLFIGILYTLPAYLAFTNPLPLSMIAATIALPMYIFGTLINAVADVQKLTAKQYGASLVSDNIWRFSRNINYFGDLLRYISFAVVAGSAWAYLVPGLVLVIYLQRISQKEQTNTAKYPEYAEYQKSSDRLIPFIW